MIFSFKLLAQQLIFEVYPNMAPKKMMKSMKAGLGKPAKVKKQAKKPAKAKSAASASLGKDKKKYPKNQLNKANLEKLGKMSLADKVKQAAEEGDTTEEQAVVLKGLLKKDEHSKVWGRYSTHLDKNPEEKKEVEQLSKKDKGLKAAQWLMQIEGKNICIPKKLSVPTKLSTSWMLGKATRPWKPGLEKMSWKPTSGVAESFPDRTLPLQGCGSTRILKIFLPVLQSTEATTGSKGQRLSLALRIWKSSHTCMEAVGKHSRQQTWKIAQREKALEKARENTLEKAKGKEVAELNSWPLKTKGMKRLKKMSPKML